MFFNIYGDTAMYQLVGWALVFTGLVLANEFARRTKVGGYICFLAIPAALTVYFIVIYACAAAGQEWALNNPTYVHMNSWFHYAKLYAATIGCIGFMLLKYKKLIGKTQWFKCYPFIIVAINILIAVASDFESAIKGFEAVGNFSGGWWFSSEGVWLYGGWWNILNGLAGIINIFCMTGWWGIYSSKDKRHQDMLWPDMTWVYILAYDVWNFEYTYLNLPTHSWYCGLALLLAPTFANFFWNKGGWIQNRANTLALWCMFAQVLPGFQDYSVFTTVSSIYPAAYDITTAVSTINPVDAVTAAGGDPTNNVTAQGIIAVLAILINVAALTAIIMRSKKQHKNPYTHEIFTDQKDFAEAMERAEA